LEASLRRPEAPGRAERHAAERSLGKVRETHPEIADTAGDELTKLVQGFRKADLDRISMAADEVGRAHANGRPAGSAGAVGVLEDEMRKSRNLKPVRKLMELAGDAVQAFKPVFLMSPLSVAQYLPPGSLKFDMLVIDEASQVTKGRKYLRLRAAEAGRAGPCGGPGGVRPRPPRVTTPTRSILWEREPAALRIR